MASKKKGKETRNEKGVAFEKRNTEQEDEKTRQAEMLAVLYGAPSDPCSIMVKEYLKHKKRTCKCLNVENKQAFLAFQSSGRVPVLKVFKDEKHILFGSNDIMRHLNWKAGRKEKEEKEVGELHETEEKRLNELLLELLLASKEEMGKAQDAFGAWLSKKQDTLADLPQLLTYLPTVDYILKDFKSESLSKKISHVKEFWKKKSSATEWIEENNERLPKKQY